MIYVNCAGEAQFGRKLVGCKGKGRARVKARVGLALLTKVGVFSSLKMCMPSNWAAGMSCYDDSHYSVEIWLLDSCVVIC